MCGNGTFGQDCTEQCGECLRKEQCHHVDGSCASECNPGYQGIMCTKGCHFYFYKEKSLLLMFYRHPYMADKTICKLSKHYELL